MMHSPPALTIRARACSVNLRAAIVKRGTSRSLESFVTAPTMTAVFSSFPLMKRAILDIEIGGLLILDILNRLRIVVANLDSARREMKLYY